MIGATVDQFKIAKLLSKSPVGEVFQAVHSQTGAQFVLQAISPQLASRAGFRKSFLEDASKMIKFEHPNVVPLVNVLEESGRLYLVREFFEGLTLAEMMGGQSSGFSLEGVLRLFKDVLRGVGYAHSEGSIHRFLNPQNILVTSDGEAKIIGFGKVLPEAEEHLMGPVEQAEAAKYFAPERIRNPNTTDIRANIYALGCILYELCTNRPPFDGGTFELQAKQHIESSVPNPSTYNPGLTPGVAQAIGRALQKRPEDRFQNTIEFYRALEQAEGQMKQAAPTPAGQLGSGGDGGLQFDLPSEAQESEFSFDLGGGSEPAPAANDGLDFNFGDAPSDDGFDDQFGDEADPFSAENLASGQTSLDFSGFAQNDQGGGLFDLDQQLGKGGKGVLDFGPAEESTKGSLGNMDLDRLSFGKESGSAEGAFGLGRLDAESDLPDQDYEEDTIQESPANLDFGGSNPPSFDIGMPGARRGPDDPFAMPIGNAEPSIPDPFDFGNEFPSEEKSDPFSSLEESSPDIDLSFKDKELNLGGEGEPDDVGLDFGNDDKLFSDTAPAKSDPPNLEDGIDLDFGDTQSAADDGAGFGQGDPFAAPEPTAAQPEASADEFGDFDLDDLDADLGDSSSADEGLALDSPEPSQEFDSDPLSEDLITDDGMNKQGLEDSLAKIEAADAAAQAKKSAGKVKVKKVRKLDKKLLGLTAGLAAIIIVAFTFWMNQQRQKKAQEKTINEIQQLVDQREYSAALTKISDFMGSASTDKFNDLLSDFQRQIRSEQRQIKEQVATLTQRAQGFEIENVLLTDGKNDAYATYHTILSMDPNNQEAKEASERIRATQLARAQSLLDSDQKVEALGIYAALSQANRGDRDTRKRYQELRDELKTSQADTLVAEIETLYTQKDYQGIVAKFGQLSQIDPKSDFVTRMRRTLVGELVSKSKEMIALRDYQKAEGFLQTAKNIDQNNNQVSDLLRDMGEERLRGDIESTADSLAKAITSKNYPRQYQLSTELLTMDPGNRTAISALDTVKAHVSNLTAKGENMREVGNFKEAASVYRQIYLINKNEQARALWSKYDNWTPPEGMAYIPAGSFKMGSRERRDTRPVQDVYITSFFIDKFEVTNRQFKAFVDANPKWRPDRISPSLHDGNYLKHWRNGKPINDDLDRPVTNVSWYAASAYATYQNKRLPTEAEWEKAAGGNTTGKKYWWGNYSDAKMAVYEFYKEKLPAPVGKFPANGFGLHEILGNVNEWTQDSYDPTFYRTIGTTRNPVNADGTKPERVFRGGSFRSRGQDLVIYLRSHGSPKFCHATVGFRCAMDSKKF